MPKPATLIVPRKANNGAEYQTRVLREYLPLTVYLEILAKRPDVQMDKLVNDSPDDAGGSRSCPRRTPIRSAPRGRNWR